MKRATLAFVLLAIFCFVSKAKAQTAGPGGHYYKVVVDPGVSWDEARAQAADATFNGLHGYLATINSLEEDQAIETLRQQSVTNAFLWIGGSRNTNSPNTQTWVWANGDGNISNQNGGDTYSNWLPGEPNDGQYLAIGVSNLFGWSSEPFYRQLDGYVVEFPGAGVQNKVSLTTIDPIAVESPGGSNQTEIAVFEFKRTGDISLDLPVFYSIGGTAQNGVDYDQISQSIVIPAGTNAARLNIVPRADVLAVVEHMETVGIRIEPSLILTPGAAYTINTTLREAEAVIYEAAPPQNMELALAIPHNPTTYADGEPVVLLAALSSTNQVPSIEFWAANLNGGGSNLIGTAIQFRRTEQVSFYRFAWTNTIPGDYFMFAHATNTSGQLVSSGPVRAIVQGPPELPVVHIRAVPPENPGVVPNADYAYGSFEFSRTGSTAGNLQVFFGLTTNSGGLLDYEQLPDYVVIGAGKTTAKLTVNAIDDNIPELPEFVELTLVTVTNSYAVDTNQMRATIWILDNDTTPPPLDSVISVVATQPDAYELAAGTNAVNGEFTFHRTGDLSRNIKIYATVSGTAGENDYIGLGNIVEFEAGQADAKMTFIPSMDHLIEGDETVIVDVVFPPFDAVTLVNVGYQIDTNKSRAVVTIHDRTPPNLPVVSVEATDPEAGEPGHPAGAGQFVVRRTGPTNTTLNVYMLYGGTAKFGTDYSVVSNTVQFVSGQVEKSLIIQPLADNLVEGDETVIASFASSPSYLVDTNKSHALITIHDQTNTNPPPVTNVVVSIEAVATETWEPTNGITTDISFILRRTGPTNTTLTVPMMYGGTATLGQDYTAPEAAVFPPGPSETRISVHPLADNLIEGDETVIAQIALNNPAYSVQPGMSLALVTIHDSTSTNSTPATNVVSIEVFSSETSEPVNGSATSVTFLLRRTGPTNNALSVPILYSGTATFGQDYTATNTAVFPPGPKETRIYLRPLADNLVEGDETVIAQIATNSAAYTVDPLKSFATTTIHDTPSTNPPPSTNIVVSLEAVSDETSEPSSNVTTDISFILRRTGPTNSPLTVLINYGGTATYGQDYTATNSVSIPPGPREWRFSLHPRADNLVEGDETVIVQLETNVTAYAIDPQMNQATVTIHDAGGPDVVILQPADGATFLLGDMVHVVVEASVAHGTITKLELLSDTGTSFTTGSRLEVNLGGFSLGEHILRGRATDSFNNVVLSGPVRILIRHRDTVSFVQRVLPETYSPSVPLTVELRATPPEGTHAYAVEDPPPAGWQVGQISHGGLFDAANQKVKFGPFTDSTNRTLTYVLTPPASATGRYTFTGNSSVNGAVYPISGNDGIELIQAYHPADTNRNSTIILSEATAYAAAWKTGDIWPVGPNPIPLSYVTRAGLIWRRGEAYMFDPSRGPAPACWVPSNGPTNGAVAALSIASAERSIPGGVQAGATAEIHIAVNPLADATSYAVEEKPPRDWAVSNISDDGVFDPDTGLIRWGVFYDATPRVLSYTLTPPAVVTSLGSFSGQFSYDGRLMDVISAPITITGGEPIRIMGLAADANNVTFDVRGPAGQTAVLESSSDFVNWHEVQSIYIPDGQVGISAGNSGPGVLFYRLRVQ